MPSRSTANSKKDPVVVQTLLTVSPVFVDFGTIPQASRKEAQVTLTNSGKEAVEIGSMRSSCECFTVKPDADFVEPGQSVGATLVVDLADEPKFLGELDLEVTGNSGSGTKTAFLIRAKVKVQSKSPPGSRQN